MCQLTACTCQLPRLHGLSDIAAREAHRSQVFSALNGIMLRSINSCCSHAQCTPSSHKEPSKAQDSITPNLAKQHNEERANRSLFLHFHSYSSSKIYWTELSIIPSWKKSTLVVIEKDHKGLRWHAAPLGRSATLSIFMESENLEYFRMIKCQLPKKKVWGKFQRSQAVRREWVMAHIYDVNTNHFDNFRYN